METRIIIMPTNIGEYGILFFQSTGHLIFNGILSEGIRWLISPYLPFII